MIHANISIGGLYKKGLSTRNSTSITSVIA